MDGKFERKICEECGGKIIKKKVDHSYLGEFIGTFPAEVCQKCGEIIFDEGVSRKMTEIVKKKGLWGLGARTKIGKVGTSLDVKINKRLSEFMKLKKGKEVEVYPESKNKLVISV
jgi:YgiT-type zinc finger domain-containing protein